MRAKQSQKMKKLFVLVFILSFSLNIKAQKDKEEKITYYTDDVVKRSKVYAGLHYSPYFLTRNVVRAETTPNDPINLILNQGTKGGFGQAYGLDLYYKFGSSLHIGVGINGSNGSYSVDFAEAVKDFIPADSIQGSYIATTKVSYLNVPIQFVYSIPIGDNWEMEVIPSVEMNFLQSLNRSGTQEPEEVGENIWGDITQQGRDLNWTVAIGVGANYRITPKFTAFVRPHFKYQLQPLLKTSGEYSGNSNEILMWIGGQTGIRFYF